MKYKGQGKKVYKDRVVGVEITGSLVTANLTLSEEGRVF